MLFDDNYDLKSDLIKQFGLSESCVDEIVKKTTITQCPVYSCNHVKTSSLVKHLQYLFNLYPELILNHPFNIKEDYRLSPDITNMVGEKLYCLIDGKVYHLRLFHFKEVVTNSSLPSLYGSSLNHYTVHHTVQLMNDERKIQFSGNCKEYKFFVTLQELKRYIFSELNESNESIST
jgi:hypothetical protein